VISIRRPEMKLTRLQIALLRMMGNRKELEAQAHLMAHLPQDVFSQLQETATGLHCKVIAPICHAQDVTACRTSIVEESSIYFFKSLKPV
jgi:hypothetical protein